jgi:soluble lytic murein transglycosylase
MSSRRRPPIAPRRAFHLVPLLVTAIGSLAAVADLRAEQNSDRVVASEAITTGPPEPGAAELPLDEALLRDPAALLREGQAAVGRSDFAAADRLFDELGRRHSIVGDYAALLRARALRDAGRPADAQIHVERGLSDFPTSPLRAELHALQGDLYQLVQDESEARGAWALAYSESETSEKRAALLARIAESQDRAGDEIAARASWQRLWIRHPASPEALRAAERLDELEARPGGLKRSAEEWRQRGDRLFAELHNEEALDAYDHALAGGLAGSLRTTTLTQRAHTLFRLRRYPEALKAFESLPTSGDVPIWRARSLARSDRVPEAIAAFETLARKPGPNQADARFFAASLLEGRGREEEARVHLVWLADDPRQGELSRTALWKLGWADYRNRRFGDAVRRFEDLASATTDPIARLKPAYWRARALLQLDQKDEAAREFESLARSYPLSYYGWRSKSLAAASSEPSEPRSLAPGRSRLTPSALVRVRILVDAGLHEEGAAETGRLVRLAGGLEDRLSLARLLTASADYHTAQRVVVDAYELELARGLIAGREEVWRLAWPFAFSELVDSATQAPGSVDPSLVYSIMREESSYRPRVISPVGARGLLQIMRETGARLAARAGRASFHPDELFDPQTNIELGSSYLGELGRQFPKRLSASIASYNAGPHVVGEWGPGGAMPDDEWVDSIPYAETQSYVKRVLRSIEAYRMIYGASPPSEASRSDPAMIEASGD